MSKKILVIAYDFPPQWGGVATYGLELALAFKNAGHKVHVISREAQDAIELPLEVTRFKLPGTGILAAPILAFHLATHLKKNAYDQVYCCLWLPDALAFWLTKKLLNLSTPYSVAVHAMEIVESSENLKKRFRKKLQPLKQKVFQEASHIFCVSEFTKDLLTSTLKLSEDRTQVVNNGANPESFVPSEKQKNGSLRLFTACRLLPSKGIDQVIKALPTLIHKFTDINYYVAGEGPDQARLKQLCDMLKVSEHVHFLGKINHQELNHQYNQADLFVMLSRKEKHQVEGFGLVFLEAALCGTPSLGGHSGGIPDAILDNKTGWLVDPYDEKKIEEKLIELLSNPDSLKEMGRVAQQFTMENRTWEKQAKKIMEVMGVS